MNERSDGPLRIYLRVPAYITPLLRLIFRWIVLMCAFGLLALSHHDSSAAQHHRRALAFCERSRFQDWS